MRQALLLLAMLCPALAGASGVISGYIAGSGSGGGAGSTSNAWVIGGNQLTSNNGRLGTNNNFPVLFEANSVVDCYLDPTGPFTCGDTSSGIGSALFGNILRFGLSSTDAGTNNSTNIGFGFYYNVTGPGTQTSLAQRYMTDFSMFLNPASLQTYAGGYYGHNALVENLNANVTGNVTGSFFGAATGSGATTLRQSGLESESQLFGDGTGVVDQSNGIQIDSAQAGGVDGLAHIASLLKVGDLTYGFGGTSSGSTLANSVYGIWIPNGVIKGTGFNSSNYVIKSEDPNQALFAGSVVSSSTFGLMNGPGGSTIFLQAPSNITSTFTLTAPSTSGSLGQAITSLGNGGLTFLNPVSIASGGTGSANSTAARTALGLGSAATLTAGSSANSVVQLNGSAQLPAVSGALLTNLPGPPCTNTNLSTDQTIPTGDGNYNPLSTTGAVTATTGTSAWVSFSGIGYNAASHAIFILASLKVSGATTIAAPILGGSNGNCVSRYDTPTTQAQITLSFQCFVTGLTAGSNVFTPAFRTTTSEASSHMTIPSMTVCAL